MSERLSKLEEYLQEGNYEMAITTYAEHPANLSETYALELARAYIVNQEYSKSVQIAQKYSNSSNPSTFYEAKIIQIKARHLLGENCISEITSLISQVQRSPQFQKHHLEFLKQINHLLINHSNHWQALKQQNGRELRAQGKQFFNLLQTQEMDNPLADGMPMFLISEVWYEKWKKFVKDEGQDSPGVITHFEILDHRFNTLWDPLSHKRYTNYSIYPSARVKILPKTCWLFLKKIYFGFDFKRFNVWIMGKPKEVMTQLHLRKISFKKQREEIVMELNISKKQNWAGVAKKLQNIWGKGFIYKLSGKQFKPVNGNERLEDIDTGGKVYVYSQQEKQQTKETKSHIYKCPVCKQTKNLKFCQCKSVKYCSLDCLKEDRDKHRKKCQLEISHLKQQAAIAQNFELAEKSFGGKKGLVGLRNLGNTCYMNSGLQCMSNTKQITEYFMTNKFLSEVNHSNPLGTKGNLACAYAELIRNMWTGSESAVSPFTLKKVIGKFAGQFSGYGQQDSQQFISYLIDGLQQDLNLVKKKQTFETNQQVIPDEEASKQSEINYAKRIKSYVRDLMSGQFKSTVICSKCNRKSICFDPYLLVTLQIPLVAKQRDLYFIPIDPSSSTKKITFTYDNFTQIGELKKNIAKRYCMESSFIKFRQVSLQTMEVLTDDVPDSEGLVETLLRIDKDDSHLMAYESMDPKNGDKCIKIDYFYEKKKISYPRFLNIPLAANSEELCEILWPSLQRFSRTYSKSYSSSLKVYKTKPQIKDESVINVNLSEQMSMLKCRTDDQRIRLHGDKTLNLNQCLTNFTSPQVLQHHNEWYCNKCKTFVKASKQMEIYKSNKILVLAFKRFSRGWKVKHFIDFPIEGLDMGPFIKSNKNCEKMTYDLYGVVNHYGTMGGGHYTAYCKNFLNNRWYQFDDSRVTEIRPKDAVSENAYVLFYRLRS